MAAQLLQSVLPTHQLARAPGQSSRNTVLLYNCYGKTLASEWNEWSSARVPQTIHSTNWRNALLPASWTEGLTDGWLVSQWGMKVEGLVKFPSCRHPPPHRGQVSDPWQLSVSTKASNNSGGQRTTSSYPFLVPEGQWMTLGIVVPSYC